MKGHVCLVVVIFCLGTAWAAEKKQPDWMSGITTQRGSFSAPEPMRATYRFSWNGIEAGRGYFVYSRPDASHLRLEAKLSSTGLARTFWPMDSTTSSIASLETFRPVRLEQEERYRRDRRITRIDFADDHLLRERYKVPDKSPRQGVKRIRLAHAHDLQSALLYLRSQPLSHGEMVRLIVYPQGTAYLATIRVTGRERVRVPAGEFPAIRLDLHLVQINKKRELEANKKVRRTTGWISDDADRLLLKIDAEIFIGSVQCELVALEKTR